MKCIVGVEGNVVIFNTLLRSHVSNVINEYEVV